jgi:hypothetical protein
MEAEWYQPFFLIIVSTLCVVYGFIYLASPGYVRQEREYQNFIFPLIASLVLAYWLGHRPINGRVFGDTGTYAGFYIVASDELGDFDWHSEWLWQWISALCKLCGLNAWGYFTVVAMGYVLSALWAVKRLLPDKSTLGMLFVLISFSFFTYGTNGIRNGLACHLLLLALSFLISRRYLVWALLCVAALGIHRSTMLPVAAMVASNWLLRDSRHAIYFWVASIPLSLLAGGAMTNFFASLGFDDRMSSYTDANKDLSYFSSSGFRWDFLLYSAMPVLLSYYVICKREIVDRGFHLIASTYCLSNAFWIIVIRASFSNRFAYLSWFLYPLVLAYPLLNLPIWEEQDKRIGQILLAFCGFTLFMEFIYW